MANLTNYETYTLLVALVCYREHLGAALASEQVPTRAGLASMVNFDQLRHLVIKLGGNPDRTDYGASEFFDQAG